ncbi:MAG: hypothetical protein KDA89_24795, partial [Planctomycetaceae bacterium]|nr:hypothetical protein [Planctomycetaceae bacterium]
MRQSVIRLQLCLWFSVLHATGYGRHLNAVEPVDDTRLQIVVDAEGFNGTPIQVIALSDDGQWIAAAAEKVVRIWNLRTREQLPALRGYQEPYGFQVGRINSLTFSPDSRFLLVGVTDNTEAGSTRIYDLSGGGKFHALVEGHVGCTRGIAFSPNGRHVATWGCDGQIIVSEWNSAAGKSQQLFTTSWSVPQMPSDRQNARLMPLYANIASPAPAPSSSPAPSPVMEAVPAFDATSTPDPEYIRSQITV